MVNQGTKMAVAFMAFLVVAVNAATSKAGVPADATKIDCSTTPQSVPHDVTSVTFLCPASCENGGGMTSSESLEIVGNGFYSEHSSVCGAAETAGILGYNREVSIILLPASSFNQSESQEPVRTFLLQNSACYVNKGEYFFSLTDVTREGGECSLGNCSNPAATRDRPWCDVIGGSWQYCDVAPACDDITVLYLESTTRIDSSLFTGTPWNKEQHKIWIIGAAKGYKVEFKIVEANLDKSEFCDPSSDHINLYHDFTGEQTFISVCDPDYREAVTSSNNLLYVEFRADNVTKSFTADVRPVADVVECDIEFINLPSGNLSTPNYPEAYPNLVTCTWKIKVVNTSVVRIRLLEFLLQDSSSENCLDGDFVEIIDGGDTLVELCGKLQTQIITSSTNDVTVKFSSDSTGQYHGFFATFQTIEKQSCYFEYFGERGNFETPGFPESFSQHSGQYREANETEVVCSWRITFEPGHNISVSFSNITCSARSSVKVYDGYHTDDNLLASLCEYGSGSGVPDIMKVTSSKEDILVVLVTPVDSTGDLSFRFDSLANLQPETERPASTSAATTTQERPASTSVATKTRMTSQRTIASSSSYASTSPTTSTIIFTTDRRSTSYTESSTDPTNYTLTTDAVLPGTQEKQNVAHIVISVLGAFLGIILAIAAVILLRRMYLHQVKYSPQRAVEDVSRTEDMELASLNTQDSA